MNIYNSIDEFAYSGKSCNVLTIGTFDGVHRGHHTILERVCSIAKAKNTESVLLTFHPHPRQVLFPDSPKMFFLNTLEERKELLQEAGIQNLIIHPFTKELSRILPVDYIRDTLAGKLKTDTLVIGHDHRFGKDRAGSIQDLLEWGPVYNFKVEEMPPVSSQGSVVSGQSLPTTDSSSQTGTVISSSKIRKALQNDDLQTANLYLGYQFFIHAIVVKGMQIGSRELGYPTANLQLTPDSYQATTNNYEKIVPADGIYAVYVEISGQSFLTTDHWPLTTIKYKGMMSIGMNPTIENKGRSMEVHIFDFHDDIYGKMVKVSFFIKIRNEEKFSNLADLKAQLDRDKEVCLGIL